MKTILIIDDEKKITDAFELYMLGEYSVISANTGESGVEQFTNKKPDLVVLDWRLNSVVEGKDVLAHIKKNSPLTPVIVVTASVHFVDEIKALKPTAYYLKPFPELKEKIRELLEC